MVVGDLRLELVFFGERFCFEDNRLLLLRFIFFAEGGCILFILEREEFFVFFLLSFNMSIRFLELRIVFLFV